VHDIGKNLVDIIISNNGYDVVNLGIKQPISNVITAFREHNANAIGLSGLLVKSTLIMRENLAVMNERGTSPPVILGGAALTRRYVEEDLTPEYAGPLALRQGRLRRVAPDGPHHGGPRPSNVAARPRGAGAWQRPACEPQAVQRLRRRTHARSAKSDVPTLRPSNDRP
jgi:hypothetical protein